MGLVFFAILIVGGIAFLGEIFSKGFRKSVSDAEENNEGLSTLGAWIVIAIIMSFGISYFHDLAKVPRSDVSNAIEGLLLVLVLLFLLKKMVR